MSPEKCPLRPLLLAYPLVRKGSARGHAGNALEYIDTVIHNRFIPNIINAKEALRERVNPMNVGGGWDTNVPEF